MEVVQIGGVSSTLQEPAISTFGTYSLDGEKERDDEMKKTPSFIHLFVLALIIVILLVMTAMPVETNSVRQPPSNSLDAYNAALQWLGDFGAARPPASAAEKNAVAIEHIDTTTPFVYQQFHGRRVWRSMIDNYVLPLKPQDTASMLPRMKHCAILIDSVLGSLVEIRLSDMLDSVLGYSLPKAEIAESQLSRWEGLHFVGLPPAPPQISAREIISRMYKYIAVSKQTTLQYLLVSRGRDTVSAWVINMHGFDYFSPRQHIPIEQRRNARIVINSTTGNSIGGMRNTPF